MRCRLVLLVVAAGIVLGGMIAAARAQTGHHPHHRDFYRHWKQPGSDLSCCDARIEREGIEVGDCEPTQAEVRNGGWFAWLRQERRWIEIPDSRIVRERNPNVTDAHLCWTPMSGVLCFVPPDTGG